MIETLLPPPTLQDNPFFIGGAPIKLWDKSDVNKAMESDTFQLYEGKPSYKYGIPISEVNRLNGGWTL